MVKFVSVISFLFIMIYGNNVSKIIIPDYYFNICSLSEEWRLMKDTVVVILDDRIIHDRIEDVGWVIYEDVPYLKGSLRKFIKKHLKYPPAALRDTLEGKVYVEFIVDTNGFTLCHKVIKGVRHDVDEEALRVARLIKFDKPAIQRGRPVEFKYCLPFVFDLSKRKKNRESRK